MLYARLNPDDPDFEEDLRLARLEQQIDDDLEEMIQHEAVSQSPCNEVEEKEPK